MQQVYRRSPMLQCDFNKVAKHLDGCFCTNIYIISLFCIRNIKYRIHSATVYGSVLFTLVKTISKAKNLILFPHCLYRYFASCTYWSLYSTRFFSTFVLLSSRFVKKVTSKIFKFRGGTNGMALNRQGRWKDFSTRGAKYHKKGHLSKFSQQAPSTTHSVYFSGF